MKQCELIQSIEQGHLRADIPVFRVGDTISVYMRIIEGEKERIQVFTGIVIARKGSGLSETMSLYRVSYGSGMERVFLLNSPRIAKIEVVKLGRVRKSKLYYLRGSSGKSAKVKERLADKKTKVDSSSAVEEQPSS
jgi:large subunit ribosomal protein L19